MPKLSKKQIVLLVVGLAVILGASIPPFMTASCFTRQQTPDEIRALNNLRGMTRGGALPPESILQKMEADFPRSKAAAMARLVRARARINAKDFTGAAALLDTDLIKNHTSIGDYALMMRADAFEQAGRPAEARIVFEQLAREYPSSTQRRTALLRSADLLLKASNASAVPLALQPLTEKDDAAALLLSARAYEMTGDKLRATALYRRIQFYAPAAAESSEAVTALARLGSSASAANAEEALARAERLFAAKKHAEAYQAYTDALAQFPSLSTPERQLRRGLAAAAARKTNEAVAALSAVPVAAGELRAGALAQIAETYARSRQWEPARNTLEELRRTFPTSQFAPRAFVNVGKIAQEAKNTAEASYLFRSAVNSFKDSIEVAQAQFDLAWEAHEAKNYQLSSQMLTEHLAYYVDRNNDNRGRAGYWAARDSERAGKLAEARAIYEGVIGRYDANWYGYLAKQRLDALASRTRQQTFAPDSLIGRAVTNLQVVTVAEETIDPSAQLNLTKADELNHVGLDELALNELAELSAAHPNSPKVNLAIAKIYRSQEENVRALNALRRSFPDYSQMKPEELTREEWDVFYPLAYWDIIVQESRTRNLDPFQVAGLIRQETVFITRARSHARAYGLMQVLVPTAALTARRYGVDRTITAEALYEPRLNIQLGTAYLRDQIDKFGRIEYVAAAYNAGPGRAAAWRTSLPAEIDEWAEAVPFKETRGYVQGVVRNRLQYERLYDKDGNFRPEVGSKAITAQPASGGSLAPSVRKRRAVEESHEE